MTMAYQMGVGVAGHDFASEHFEEKYENTKKKLH